MPRFIYIPPGVGLPGPTGPKAGPPFVFSTVTTDTDPGVGKFQISDADVNGADFLYINKTTNDGYDMSSDFGIYEPGGRLYFEQAVGNKRTTFQVVSVEDKTDYWKIGVTLLSGVNFVVGTYVISYFDSAETLTYDDLDDPNLPAPGANPGMAVIFNNISKNSTGSKCLAVSDGTNYVVIGRLALEHDNVTHGLVFPNTGITWTASNVGGLVKLTSNADHGLSSAKCDGKASLHIKTASTGFALYDLLPITSVINTTEIQTSFPWPGGTPAAPIISVVGETAQLKPTKTPPLRKNSRIIIDSNYIASGSSAKTVNIKFGGNDIFTPSTITTATTLHIPVEVYNKNDTNSQETRFSISHGSGAGTGAPGATFNVETNAGAQEITFHFYASTVDEVIGVRSRLIELVH